MVGSWDINVEVGKMPQKIASAMTNVNENIIGVQYTPIAYLGSQLVNGTNHAVLAEQIVLTGKDTKNLVILIFNEKANTSDVALIGIERVLESGAELGGIEIDVKDISEDAQDLFDKGIEGFVGYRLKPFALAGTQITKGTNYIYVVESESGCRDSVKSVSLVIINLLTKNPKVIEILSADAEISPFGYSIGWIFN